MTSKLARLVDLGAKALRCGWCEVALGTNKRAESVYCSKRCRQAAWRFQRECPAREAATEPRRWGFADPPYPGLAGYYRDHPDFAGEVDHAELVARLCNEFDGWALCTSSDAAREVWNLCPEARLAPWVRGARHARSHRPQKAWEAVFYFGDRPLLSTQRVDALTLVAKPRLTDPRRVIGAKPSRFAFWIFDLLGALPGDEFVDLYPGSGGVARAWDVYTSRRPASATPGGSST